MAAIIKEVIKNSIAEELGVEPGDTVLSIDGFKIDDILDYQFHSQDDSICLEIIKANRELWSLEIEKDYDEELGIVFEDLVFDRMNVCQNRCIFCFVDQLPRKMRKTLYVKDDDFRYSFLLGNFITLTNLSEDDWQKIISMRLSPLYVSVHCMGRGIRAEMLGNPKAADIKEDLSRLKEAGIEVHTQMVLCPGVNDGEALKESISELAEFFPSVVSVGVVPVGLSGHRRRLRELRAFTADEAKSIIKMAGDYQARFRSESSRGFVYLADEFYVLAGQDFPPASYYDDYCQIENGIGLARILLDDFAELEPSLPASAEKQEATLIAGVSALPVLRGIVERLNRIDGLTVELVAVKNNFFGGNVSVTGLLTGSDIIAGLGGKYKGKKIIIPEVVLKEGNDILLDNITLKELEEKTGAFIVTVDGSAGSLIKAVLDGGM